MKKHLALIFILFFFMACDENSTSDNDDGFNRKNLLTNWVNNIIKPSYAEFQKQLMELQSLQKQFVETPTEANLILLQKQLFETQKAWQWVSIFEFEKAEELNYRAQMNTFPVDMETPTSNGNSSEDKSTLSTNLSGTPLPINQINFDLTIRADEQGLPTVDYLLNGVANTPTDIVNFYSSHSNAPNHKLYLETIVDRMVNLTKQVVDYWNANASKVIQNSGSSATASFDKLLNRFVQYVEKGFREPKIATPSGKRSGTKDPKKVESYYSAKNSKALLLEAFKAIQGFYYGTHFAGETNGFGIDDYLIFLKATEYDTNTVKEVELSKRLPEIFKNVTNSLSVLNGNLAEQVTDDNSKMLAAFNVIQSELVRTLKSNVMLSLGVNVGYADGDGD